VRRLAADIGVTRVVAVANRVRGADDLAFVSLALDGMQLIGTLPDSPAVRTAEQNGRAPLGCDPVFDQALSCIASALTALTAALHPIEEARP
jgi:CO dehydrogenase nickel-insertion accessory protein CooC1